MHVGLRKPLFPQNKSHFKNLLPKLINHYKKPISFKQHHEYKFKVSHAGIQLHF